MTNPEQTDFWIGIILVVISILVITGMGILIYLTR